MCHYVQGGQLQIVRGPLPGLPQPVALLTRSGKSVHGHIPSVPNTQDTLIFPHGGLPPTLVLLEKLATRPEMLVSMK